VEIVQSSVHIVTMNVVTLIRESKSKSKMSLENWIVSQRRSKKDTTVNARKHFSNLGDSLEASPAIAGPVIVSTLTIELHLFSIARHVSRIDNA